MINKKVPKQKIYPFGGILTDITKNREIEESLSLEAKALQASVDAIVITDTKGIILRINNAFTLLTGYEAHEAIGHNMSILNSGKQDNAYYKKFWDGILAGETHRNEIVNRRKDGSLYDEEETVTPVKDDNGKIAYFISIKHDITEKKKEENAVRESQATLQRIIELLPIRVFWKDINLNYLGCNTIFAKDAGKQSPQDLVGKSDFDMAWKDQADSYRADDTTVIKSGVSKLDYEEILITPTGDKRWINANKVPLKDGLGKIIGVLGTYIDITKHKEREQLLKEMQSIAHMGIYRTDFTKNKWESSDILDEIFGIDKNFIRSVKGWTSIIHPDDQKMVTDYLQNEVFSKQHNFDKEYRIIQRNSGKERWVHGLGQMTFDKQNRPLIMTGTIQDITESKKTEEELMIKNQEFEKINHLMIGRELKMIELKKQIEEMEKLKAGNS